MKTALVFCWLFLSYHVVREVPGGRPITITGESQDAKVEWQKLNEQCTWRLPSLSAAWTQLKGKSDVKIFGCRPVPKSQLVASSCARRPLLSEGELSPSSRCRLTDAYMHEEKSYEREGGSSTFVDLHERLIIAWAEEMKACDVTVDGGTVEKLWDHLKHPLKFMSCHRISISMFRSVTFLAEADGHKISEKVLKVLADISGKDGRKMNEDLKEIMPKCHENQKTCADQIANVLTKTLSPSTADSSPPLAEDEIDAVVTQLLGKDDQVPANGTKRTSQLQVLSNEVAVLGDAAKRPPGMWTDAQVRTGSGLGVLIGYMAMSSLMVISADLIIIFAPVLLAGLVAGMSLVWLYRAVVRGLSSIIRQFAAKSSGPGGALVEKIQVAKAASEETQEEGTKCSLADYQAAGMEGASNNDPDKGAEAAEENQALPATTLTSTERDAKNQHGSNVLE